MMILHGENNLLSRQKLNQEIDNFKLKTQGEILRYDGQNINLIDLKQSLESPSLLNDNYLIVLENLFSGRTSKEKQKIIDYLKKSLPKNLIIWEGKKIDGRILISFKGQNLRFDLDPVIFRFLDSLTPGNTKNSLSLLHQCLTQDSPEIILFMLQRQIKYFIIAVDLGQKGLTMMDSWRAQKLSQQAKKFTLVRLMKIYRQLLKIEAEQKTGRTPFNLASQLDLLIASV